MCRETTGPASSLPITSDTPSPDAKLHVGPRKRLLGILAGQGHLFVSRASRLVFLLLPGTYSCPLPGWVLGELFLVLCVVGMQWLGWDMGLAGVGGRPPGAPGPGGLFFGSIWAAGPGDGSEVAPALYAERPWSLAFLGRPVAPLPFN